MGICQDGSIYKPKPRQNGGREGRGGFSGGGGRGGFSGGLGGRGGDQGATGGGASGGAAAPSEGGNIGTNRNGPGFDVGSLGDFPNLDNPGGRV